MHSFNFEHSVLLLSLALLGMGTLNLQADFVVKADEPNRTGNKTVIKLELKNTFSEKIESARAQVFLLDEQGKVVNQAIRWVIGGTKEQPGLPPGEKTTFHFAIPTSKPFATSKIIFSRIVLDGGKAADPLKSVEFVKE